MLNGLKFKFCRTIVRCRPVTTANYMISAYSIEAFTVNSSQSCTYSRIKEKRTAQLFHMHTQRRVLEYIQYSTVQNTVHRVQYMQLEETKDLNISPVISIIYPLCINKSVVVTKSDLLF